ncbi:protein DJ-1 homolog B-like [Gossypium arboreum]|nr:protein DJ-1 homolog B-like [Gossypium arboreum]
MCPNHGDDYTITELNPMEWKCNNVLQGKKATAYPAMCDKLSDQSHIDNRVVVDGNLITSRGPGTSIEFALGIVEKFFGRPKALELAKGLLVVRK